MKMYYRIGKSQKQLHSGMMFMCSHYWCCCYKFDIKGGSLNLYMIRPEDPHLWGKRKCLKTKF